MSGIEAFTAIMRDAGACDGAQVLEYRTPVECWASPWLKFENHFWIIDTFSGDRYRPRARRALQAIARTFTDLAELARAEGGAGLIPVGLVEELQRRVVLSLYPSLREVIEESQRPPGPEVRRALTRQMGESWPTKSS